MNYNIDEFENQFDSEEKVASGTQYVDEKLWEKVEKLGSKIRFAKDIKALYRYMKDKYVPWYRKSIVIAALIYFISPIDTIPDLAPLIGYLDDLGVIMAVTKFLGNEIIPYYD
ncbi:MAG: DUF1232 domain-containing protein [Ignavibacteriales bacterium]|jgi:uncharacterized membrane protein YkvA (DUF1232 family)|nr:DUF1232 domain-containing protein [Ignavibacteriales bacterium]